MVARTMTETIDASEARARIERGSEFEDQRFEHAELRKLSLAGKTFTGCTFDHCMLHETNWRGALLEDCTFADCDLSRATLDGTRLRDVVFRRSRLMGVDWSPIGEFAAFSLDDCDLQYATFVALSLRKLRCHNSRVTEATFDRCDLTQADFAGCDLRATRFERCELSRADFSRATGALIDPTQNKAKGAKVSAEGAALLAAHFGLTVANGARR